MREEEVTCPMTGATIKAMIDAPESEPNAYSCTACGGRHPWSPPPLMAQTIPPNVKKVLRPLVEPVRRRLRNRSFAGSVNYWENRYATGGYSGAGSYGVLADFKASFLNGFVEAHGIETVMDFGCGDGNQLSLAHYPAYMGLDVSTTSIDMCTQRFEGDSTKSFYLYDSRRFLDNARLFRADLTLSLDVIYHLIEDEIFDSHMRHLFAAADRNVIIYATNAAIPDSGAHVHNRHFTPWVDANMPDWRLLETVKNAYPDQGGKADFFVFERLGRWS